MARRRKDQYLREVTHSGKARVYRPRISADEARQVAFDDMREYCEYNNEQLCTNEVRLNPRRLLFYLNFPTFVVIKSLTGSQIKTVT